MNKLLSRWRSDVVLAFIVGIVVGCGATVFLGVRLGLARSHQKREAVDFFYRTMNSLFQGTYNSEDGSISQQALDTFKEYQPRLGNKCQIFVVDRGGPYYDCVAFFPSGDFFNIVIHRKKGFWVLRELYHGDWDRFWRVYIQHKL